MTYDEWKAMWDRSGPFPVITHADAHLLLTEIARLEAELIAAQGKCRGFYWLGQPFTSCDNCGRPAWEHDGMSKPSTNDPFSHQPPTLVPWKPGEAEAIRRKWDRTP